MRQRQVAQGLDAHLSRVRQRNNVPVMKYAILVPAVLLAGCSSPSLQGIFDPVPAAPAPEEVVEAVAPEPVVETLDPTPPPPPPPQARTVEQFDTTSAEDRAAAVAPPEEPEGEVKLGTTIATLGPPTEPGIWLKTPLVSELVAGRVEFADNGKSVNLELRPSGGAAGSGSQISLAAMRLLEAPLTGLLNLIVYKD